MPTVGMRLAHYEICEKLGAGGMGEVYRARDTKLNRDVAIKVLPPRLADDPEIRLRFEREARAIAQLSHPNVRAIYDFDVAGDAAFAVMEYLEGESLRGRLARGSIPLAEGLALAIAVAEGLAAIHQKGILHRDIKPENIFLTADGQVKILDFGVARMPKRPVVAETDETVSTRDTLTTSPGMVVGTIGYMSPEQVRGGPLDARSDIFALGCVLFEVFTGRRAFPGATQAEVAASILRDNPFAQLSDPPSLPGDLWKTLERCLNRQPTQRFQSAQDLAFILRTLRPALSNDAKTLDINNRETLRLPPSEQLQAAWPVDVRPERLWWGAGALLATALVGLVAVFIWSGRPKPAFLTYTYLTNAGSDTTPAWSPDGQSVAFASQRDGRQRIWVKRIVGDATEVAITEGEDSSPRYSPDGQQIAFVRRARDGSTALYVVSSLGGVPRKIVDDGVDGDWSPDGRRLCVVRWVRDGGITSTLLESVESDGSNLRPIARLDGLRLRRPRWSPDGKHIALVKDVVAGNVFSPVTLITVTTGAVRQLEPTERGGYVSSPAWLEDSSALVVIQSTSPEAPNIITPARVVVFSVSTGSSRVVAALPHDTAVCDLRNGRLVYESRSRRGNLVEARLGARPGELPQLRVLARGTSIDRQPRYTPGGDGVVFTSNRTGNNDIWRLNFADGRLAPLTAHPDTDWDPALSPDGQTLYWSSNRTGKFEIWTATADGMRGRAVTAFNASAQNPTPSPDGRFIFFTVSDHPTYGVWQIRVDGTDGRQLVADLPARWPEVSPDGQYVLYVTTMKEGNGNAIRVARVTDGAQVFSIEVGLGGLSHGRARWSPDGQRIGWVSTAGDIGIFAQDFRPGTDTTSTRRRILGDIFGSPPESFAFSPDGQKLVVAASDDAPNLMVCVGIPDLAPAGSR
ncbi:serine/threonine-protein kinase [Chloracidobacterium validum]|uniref:Serine/threonine-protein kinase n=1 Tax=Chloracidobacterium validum TaxID=2821543 RepID=A0ABX8BF14_9BACT|nr:protein kinase [Chloracidobacterium validum]QUW04213.1 serine/threonine-protein kinase [Chloracidobacterium validum]